VSGVLALVLYYQLNQLRHLFVIVGAGAAWPQYDAGAPHQRMRHAARAHHRLQLQTVGLVKKAIA
jgi:hypothetical protein